jgi:hypothetical protein
MGSSNNVIGGFGRNIVLGGLAGNALPSTATSLFQNPDFEIPDVDPGEASNWSTEQVYSDVEYASFSRPGLAISVTSIPAEQPSLGFTIVHQTDGTISILQAADTEDAAEDFEEGWNNNEQYFMALPDNAVTFATFQNNNDDSFDFGWNNDEGFLDVFTEVLSVRATFSVHLDPLNGLPVTFNFENYEGYWPAAATQPYTTSIPDVIFGTCDPTTLTDLGQFNSGDRIIESDTNGYAQYADVLILTLTEVPKTPFTLQVHYLDREEHLRVLGVVIPQDTAIGESITATSMVPYGIRYIDTVIEDPTYGFPGVILHGEPGVLFDVGGNIVASWVRAEFA